MRRGHLLLLHPRPSTIPFHPSLHAARSPTPSTTSRFHPSRDRTRATTRNVPTTIYITGTRTAVLEDHLSKAARKLVQRIEWNVVLTLFLARPSVCVMFLDMIYHYVLRREA